MSPLGGFGLFVGGSAQSPTPGVLTVDRTIHVDSVAGNDIGDGSSVLPFATLARAWTERLTYGELRAKLIVQLHGVGPYTMPVMGASVCAMTGWFIVQGDPTVDVVNASGTFTGDLNTTTCVVGASAGFGADTYKGKQLRITSGNCNGARCRINSHSDASFTLMLSDFRATAIVNGDTFQIFTPGTVINVPAVTAASGQPVPGGSDWLGGGTAIGYAIAGSYPRHIFYNLSFSGGSNTAHFRNCAVAFVGVDANARLQWYRSQVAVGLMDNGAVLGAGADSATHLLTGCGMSCAQSVLLAATSTMIAGSLYTAAGTFFTCGSLSIGDELILNGARFDGSLSLNGARLEGFNTGIHRVSATLSVSQGASLILNAGLWTFAVSSGDAILAKDGALVVISPGVVSGGTSAGAGYGLRAISGAKILCVAHTPTLTGGTLNNDIKAENTAAIANSTLSASGQSTLDAVTQAIVMRVAA